MPSLRRNTNAYLLLLIACLLATLTPTTAAEPELSVSEAVAVSYATVPGRFYQLQVKDGDQWTNAGLAVPGTGKWVKGFFPAG
ncbi:MAG: hypothetical protein H8E44_01225, partial [Planctomycetes bacterium]|nr:hypothetical protein [Planctomycetota bacterium]